MKQKFSKKAQFYDSIASDFDSVMNKYEVKKRLQLVFNELSKEKLRGKKVLDAGCGTGIFSKRAYEAGSMVTSLDIGQNLLNEVKKKCKAKLVIGSVTSLPFGDACFDVVISTEVIEHTENPKKAVSELARVLKPGGILVITTPNKIWKWALLIANFLKIRPYYSFENWLGVSELKDTIEKNNLKIEKGRGFNIIPLFYPPFYKFIDFFDRFGTQMHSVMVNSLFVAVKTEVKTR